MYEIGYWDENEKCIKSFHEISMCGCSKRNRLTGKALEERHKNLSKNCRRIKDEKSTDL